MTGLTHTEELPLNHAAPRVEGLGGSFPLLFSVFRIVQLFCIDLCCWVNEPIGFFLGECSEGGQVRSQVPRRSVWFEQTESFRRGQLPRQRGLLELRTGHLNNTCPSDLH